MQKFSYLPHWMCDGQSYTTIIANPLYLIINKINWYIEESNENKYLALVPTDGSKSL